MFPLTELVLPAGTLEKLQTAVRFGANAVYAAGQSFGLRAYAGNLGLPEMKEGLDFAHLHQARMYITVNVLAHNEDIHALPVFLEQLEEVGPDGIIVSDPGVMKLAAKYCPSLPITVSTQANVSNYASAGFYEDLGVRRIVLARELTLDEICEIRNRVQVELEMFVQGAMCVSYSGRCLLSYYMTGRSANRGACAHPCRYQYHLNEEKRPGQFFSVEEDEQGVYLFNSKDLCLLPHIPELLESGINALKVEGRMKSPLYVATAATVYRRAIDACQSGARLSYENGLPQMLKEMAAVSPRSFTSGFLHGPDNGMNDFDKQEPPCRSDFCGMIIGFDQERGGILVEQRSNFGPGDQLEIFQPDGTFHVLKLERLYDIDGQELDRARHPRQTVFLPCEQVVQEGSILRRRSNNE